MWRFCSLISSIASWILATRSYDQLGILTWSYAPIARSNLSETLKIVEKPIILHHDNAPAHTSMLARESLVKNKIIIMPQPPHSPDLPTTDFYLFPRLKTPIKGKSFAKIEEIKENSTQELLAISKCAFRKCFEDGRKRWQKWLKSEGG